MSGTIDDTGPEPGPEPIRYSVAAAALRLGISERAVRQRIQAGTLHAEPQGRSYWVYLSSGPESGPEGPEPAPVPLDRNGPEPGPLSRTQEATIALVQSMLEPFVKELGETKEQLGRVTAERDELQRRLDLQDRRDTTTLHRERAGLMPQDMTESDDLLATSEQRNIDYETTQVMDQDAISQLVAERDALQARLSALEAQSLASPAPAPAAPQIVISARQKRRLSSWWVRMFGRDE